MTDKPSEWMLNKNIEDYYKFMIIYYRLNALLLYGGMGCLALRALAIPHCNLGSIPAGATSE